MKKLYLSVIAIFCFAWSIMASGITMYAAPKAAGKGNGSSKADAARFWDAALWKNIQNELQKHPVTLELLPGKYITTYPAKQDTRLNLNGIGHDQNQLIIRGAANHAAVFSRNPQDSKNMEPASKNLQNLITLRKNCRNIVFEQLYFTGDGACG